jgi:hypothetical protein
MPPWHGSLGDGRTIDMSLAERQLSHCRSCGASIYMLKNDTTD